VSDQIEQLFGHWNSLHCCRRAPRNLLYRFAPMRSPRATIRQAIRRLAFEASRKVRCRVSEDINPPLSSRLRAANRRRWLKRSRPRAAEGCAPQKSGGLCGDVRLSTEGVLTQSARFLRGRNGPNRNARGPLDGGTRAGTSNRKRDSNPQDAEASTPLSAERLNRRAIPPQRGGGIEW
jgi:hypothetical protein